MVYTHVTQPSYSKCVVHNTASHSLSRTKAVLYVWNGKENLTCVLYCLTVVYLFVLNKKCFVILREAAVYIQSLIALHCLFLCFVTA